MKSRINLHLILLFFCFGISNFSFAQSNIPNAVNFQSIARDGLGNLVTNTNIEVQFTILDGGPLGTALRQPRFIRNTDQYGQFSLTISEDSATSFGPSGATPIPNIDWASGNKWIKIEFRPNLISPYTLIETIRCNSTFYAFAAKSAEKISIAGVNGQVLKHNGTTWVAGSDMDSQNISISGNQISLTGSVPSTITLPATEMGVYQERYINPNFPTGGLIALNSWVSIPLNTAQFPSNSPDISVSGSVITLQPGTYRIRGFACFDVQGNFSGLPATFELKSRLLNLSSNTTSLIGTKMLEGSNSASKNIGLSSLIDGVIVVSNTTTFSLQRYVFWGGGTTFLLGIYSFSYTPEPIVMSQISIEKL